MNPQQELMGFTEIIGWEGSRYSWLIAVMDGVWFYLFYRRVFFVCLTQKVVLAQCLCEQPPWTLKYLDFVGHILIPDTSLSSSRAFQEGNVELQNFLQVVYFNLAVSVKSKKREGKMREILLLRKENHLGIK